MFACVDRLVIIRISIFVLVLMEASANRRDGIIALYWKSLISRYNFYLMMCRQLILFLVCLEMFPIGQYLYLIGTSHLHIDDYDYALAMEHVWLLRHYQLTLSNLQFVNS